MPQKPMTAIQEKQTLKEVLETIRERLPAGWSFQAGPTTAASAKRGADFLVKVNSPNGQKAVLAVQVKLRTSPALTGFTWDGKKPAQTMIVVPFLSPATRRELVSRGVNFADRTGNVRLVISRPGLFVETSGAITDPAPPVPKRSLKGTKTSRIVRALIDTRPPFRLTDIATRSAVDVGLVSRLLQQFEQEGVLTREKRAAVTAVNWEELIRRWAEEYKVTKSNAATYMLEPRGLSSLLTGLRTTTLRYALTGSVAASMRATVAPAALAMLYVEDRGSVADELKLRPADSGGNVVILVPRDSLPFEGTTREQDLVMAAPSQVAADLLTGPGRSSSEAEAFIDWMKANENVWRG